MHVAVRALVAACVTIDIHFELAEMTRPSDPPLKYKYRALSIFVCHEKRHWVRVRASERPSMP